MGANGDLGSYNLYAYCSNNPICRVDATGQLWGTALATIGISAVASVAVSAISAFVHKEAFTVGDAVGAAIDGGMAAAMMIVGVPAVLANPTATLCGSVIGKYIDGDFSKEATHEILENTKKTALITAGFAGAGKIVSKYAATYLSGKYINLSSTGEFIADIAYQPKYINKSSIRTITSEIFWDSAQTLTVDLVW